MAETWDKLFRQVVLRAGLLKADDATSLEAMYTVPIIGQTEMNDRAVMFPKSSIDDALLMAGDQIVRAFAGNPASPYRRNFADTTGTVASDSMLPTISTSGMPIVGVIGDVRDSVSGTPLERIETTDEISTMLELGVKQNLYFYWTDYVRILHTRLATEVFCDVVVWDKAAERVKLAATPARGACNFTEDLHEALICGALATTFRSSFNAEQVEVWATYFKSKIAEISKMGVSQTVSTP